MTFGEAIAALKQGKKVCRAGWNGKNMWLCYISGSEGDGWTHARRDISPRPHLPFLAMNTAQQDLVPWLASQTDMLSEDWEVVDG